MCGITGAYLFNSEKQDVLQQVKLSADKLQQRGPDFTNKWQNNRCALGHARLSIIDTSDAANQPFVSQCGNYIIIFNGEIYNYRTLKKDLQNKGYTFKSESDTEVLLNLFIEYGEKCLDQLNGFFAFAVYNKKADTLFIARDRYGIKPLIFYRNDDFFCFASEIKSLIQYSIKKSINSKALKLYFQLGYIPSPHSIFDGVIKLNPGHYLWVDKHGVKTEKYYEIRLNPILPTPNYEVAQKRMKELLEESVKKRLIADVPLGTFLSGGIDSSVISTIAAKYTQNLNTFSIGYKDEPFFDETKYANLVAKKIKSNHTVFSLSNDDLFEHFERIVNYIDEPFADSSAIAVNILCYHTKNKITVALSGDGADELFSGYNKHKAFYLSQQKGLKNQLLKQGGSLAKLFPKSRNNPLSNKARQVEKYAKGLKLNSQDRYWLWACLQHENEVEKLLLNKPPSFEMFEKIISCDEFNQFLLNDFNMVLEGDMLKKVDSMSMANGLEVRVPFLDHNLVNYVFSLPAKYKIDKTSTKKLLKDAYKNDLPDELYTRKKHGFEVPLKKWILNDLEPLLNDILSEEFIKEQGIFNYERITFLRKKARSNNPEDTFAVLWMLIVFQKWYKNYVLA